MSATDRDYRQWLRRADSDWLVVERLADEERLWEARCFHAQQALEKLLKGLLVLHGNPYPKIHDLVKLVRLVTEVVPEIAPLEADMHAITLAYPRSRYPDELNELSPQDAADIVNKASEARTALLRHFPAERE